MGWSIPLGKVKGTVIRLHVTFLLLLAWFAAVSYAEGGRASALAGVSFLILLFLCVVLHEFGHILVARRFGVRTQEILLLPIGGMARMERIPERPREELLVALAGPAVTVAIALVLVLAFGGFPDPEAVFSGVTPRDLLGQLAYANLSLLAFNLLPVFPLDGGRVLRALLAAKLGYSRGTEIAAVIGRVAAIVLGLVGLVAGHVILVLIAAFIFLAAGAEAGFAQLREITFAVPARDVMITAFESLAPEAPVTGAAEALIGTSQHDFPVVDDAGVLVGLLTRDLIIKALSEGPGRTPVADVMRSDIPSIPEWHRLDDGLALLQSGVPALAVTGPGNRLVGLITSENLLEQMMIARARGRHRRDERRRTPAPFAISAA